MLRWLDGCDFFFLNKNNTINDYLLVSVQKKRKKEKERKRKKNKKKNQTVQVIIFPLKNILRVKRKNC